MRSKRSSGLLCCALVAGALAGCGTAKPQSRLFTAVAQSGMSLDELRIRVRTFGSRFSGEMEAVADDIARQTTDTRIRLAMVSFKINGIPAIQAALFEPDPVAALLDAWVLLVQIELAVD